MQMQMQMQMQMLSIILYGLATTRERDRVPLV